MSTIHDENEAVNELIGRVLEYVAYRDYPSQADAESAPYYSHLEYLRELVQHSARKLTRVTFLLPKNNRPIGWDD